MAIEQRARTKDRHRPSAWTTTSELGMEMDEAVGVECVAEMAIGVSCRLGVEVHEVEKAAASSGIFLGVF